jgi:hypothetical protein
MRDNQIRLGLTVLNNIKAMLETMAKQARTEWARQAEGLDSLEAESITALVTGCNDTIMGVPVVVKVTRTKGSSSFKTTFYLDNKVTARKDIPMEILRRIDLMNPTKPM